MATEVTCSTCVAACCRAGVALSLTSSERYKHRRAMELQTLAKPQVYSQDVPVNVEHVDSGRRWGAAQYVRVPAYYGFHILIKDCGHLEGNSCGAYETRPLACRDFEVGSELCLSSRAAFGLDGVVVANPLAP